MEQIGGGKQRINAQVPQAEVARYVIDLRSMTGGRGAFSMTLRHYEELPTHLAQKVIAEHQKAAKRRRRSSDVPGAYSFAWNNGAKSSGAVNAAMSSAAHPIRKHTPPMGVDRAPSALARERERHEAPAEHRRHPR